MSATLLNPPETEAALMFISGLCLMLPQSEVRGLETSAAMDTEETKPYSVGWVRINEERWPVYCLSPELTLLLIAPKERRSCLVLDTGAGYIGILCDEFTVGEQIALDRQHDLPSAMRLPDTPLLGLAALADGQVACITNAERLVEHVNRQVNR